MTGRPLDERDCRFVSSRGILKSCNVFAARPVSSVHHVCDHDWRELRAGDIVYVHGSAIMDFCNRVLPLLRVPIVLVSGDCDDTMPFEAFLTASDFRAFVEHPLIWHWFAQNLALVHSKWTHLPIGLDYHTLAQPAPHTWGAPADPPAQDHALAQMAQQAPAWKDRIPRAYCNFQFQTSSRFGNDREIALAHMNPSALYIEPRPIPRLVTWQTQATYAFVASPAGCGLDCHRTWEALALGCVPIVKRSLLDPLYAGLPVLIVDDWSDVTPERLKAVHDNPPERSGMEKLTLAYWVGLMRAQQQACLASTGE